MHINVTLRRVRGKGITITNAECASAALVIQQARRKRCIILSYVAYLAQPYFFTLFYKQQDFRGKTPHWK